VCQTPLPACIHSMLPGRKTPDLPVVSANRTEPSSVTVTVAMPECGCQPCSIEMGAPPPSNSNRSRKTNGFISSPRSDGLTRRVTGPLVCPRVRWTILRVASRAWIWASNYRLSSLLGEGLTCNLAADAGTERIGRYAQPEHRRKRTAVRPR